MSDNGNNGTVRLVTITELERSWKTGSEQIRRFLKARKIQPVHEIKFGRGMLRYYPESVRELAADFRERIPVHKKNGDKPPVTEEMAARMAAMRAKHASDLISANPRLTAIEQKLDRIMSELGIK